MNKIKAEKGEKVLRDGNWGGNFRQASQRRPKQKGNISVRQVCVCVFGGGGGRISHADIWGFFLCRGKDHLKGLEARMHLPGM